MNTLRNNNICIKILSTTNSIEAITNNYLLEARYSTLHVEYIALSLKTASFFSLLEVDVMLIVSLLFIYLSKLILRLNLNFIALRSSREGAKSKVFNVHHTLERATLYFQIIQATLVFNLRI